MFQEYLRVIKKYRYSILSIGIVAAIVAFVFTLRQPNYYSSSLSLLISNDQIQETQDYRFDGYYTIQAVDLFSNNIEAWLQSPEVVNAIFRYAKVNLNALNIKEFTKIFKVEKLASHYVEVRYKSSNEEEAVNIASAITGVLSEKTKSLSELSKNQTTFSISSGKPVTVLTKQPILVNTVVAFVVGLFVGFLLIIIKEYQPREETK